MPNLCPSVHTKATTMHIILHTQCERIQMMNVWTAQQNTMQFGGLSPTQIFALCNVYSSTKIVILSDRFLLKGMWVVWGWIGLYWEYDRAMFPQLICVFLIVLRLYVHLCTPGLCLQWSHLGIHLWIPLRYLHTTCGGVLDSINYQCSVTPHLYAYMRNSAGVVQPTLVYRYNYRSPPILPSCILCVCVFS